MGDFYRIGDFELDPGRYQLTRAGRNVKLERLPLELLLLLVELRDRVVTRDEIVERLWGKNLFVDADNSVNTAMRKLRAALRDPPQRSYYIKTISGKGYRLVAPVDQNPNRRETLVSRRRIMLAVLPFENMSGDPEQEYFADGLTEEAIRYLGQMDPQRLGVIARTSSMAYKRTTKSVAEIAAELGVDYVLESSLRRQGDQIRITAKLVRSDDQTPVWSQSYDRSVGDVIGLQEDIGSAIGAQVRTKLIRRPKQVHQIQTHDSAAYDLYLRGRYHWNQLTPTGITEAIRSFELAVAQDPRYAFAYAALAECFAILPITCDAKVSEVHPKAVGASMKALELNGSLAEAHASAGAIQTWMEFNWKAAEVSLQRAIKLNPSYVHAHRWFAVLLSATGRHAESAAEMKTARQLDPLSPLMHGLSGALMYNARRDEAAIKHLRDAVSIAPKLWVLHLWIAKALERIGHVAEALEEYQTAFELSGRNTESIALRAYIQARSGNRAAAEEALRVLLDLSEQTYVPPYNIATIFAGLGEEEKALDWLERALADRDARLIWVGVESKWDALRKHGRFRDLLCDLALPLEPVAWESP